MASSEKIIADETDIQGYIPQRLPMVMIGKLLEVADKKTVTSFIIKEDNLFCSGGFFREPGLIENMAQTAAAGVGYLARQNEKDLPVGFIGGLKNLRIRDFPKCGDEIVTEVTVEHEVFDATVASGKVFLEEHCIAECELKIFLLNKR
jgi:3-hydroxymyristoyl/3-hydroxydecanoyl-(acyl carrier protein) dehydratase